MQRIKPIVKDAFLYFFQIYIYIWPSFLIGNNVVGLIVRIAMNNSNETFAKICETITCVVVLCAFLFIYAYRRGHKRAEFHYKNLLISLLLAFGLQFIYAIIFRFNVYTNAGAYFFATLLHPGEISSYDIPTYIYVTTMCIVDVFYVVAVISGEYLGKKKRLRERSVLNLDEENKEV